LTSAVTASLAAFAVTLLSGLLALHLRGRKSIVYASSAGALIGAAALFLLPDAMRLVGRTNQLPMALVWLAAVLGFLIFYGLERAHSAQSARLAGLGGAIGLAVHSFFDGVVIGQGFRAGEEIGYVLALAVMLHRMADGAGAVGLMLATDHGPGQTAAMLVLTALAPVLGAIAQSFVEVPAFLFALLLSFFAGMLFYSGSLRLFPEARRASISTSAVSLYFVAGFAIVCAAYVLSHS
jgi:ZIP family zinc transporter